MYENNLSTETFPKSDPEILKLGAEVRRLMTEAMKRARKNAKQVAKEMSECLGLRDQTPELRPITEGMIYQLTRNGGQGQPREMRLLAIWVAAFCEVTGDDRLQRLLAGPRLREFIEWGERIDALESNLAKMQEAVRKLKAQGRQRKGKVKA